MDPSDAELMALWLQGDAAGFEGLVRRWQQPVARTLSRLLGRPDVVPDLCQEVFLKVFRARPTYRENGAFASWLYRITVNVARDAERRRRPVSQSLDGDHWPDTGRAPDAASGQHELERLVATALAELPQPQREVVVLRHFEGMSFEDIARMMGIPASTLKSRFAVAIQRLKKRFEQMGIIQ
jgi:RNA polymerase sigma-70 factor (ECF subfamily)